MNSISASFNVVAPMFILMLIGFLIKKLGLISNETIKQMNSISFRFYLPAALLSNILSCNLKQDFDSSVMFWGTIISFALSVIAFVIALVFEKDGKRRGALAQCIFRNNFMLFSLSIVYSVYGDDSSVKGLIAMLPAIVIPMNNVFGVLEMLLFVEHKQSPLKLLKNIILNPFVIATVVGFAVLFMNITVPSSVSKAISNLGSIATPLLFMLLGASFTLKITKQNLKTILVAVISKMIILPALFFFVMNIFNIRFEKLLVLFIVVVTPPAIPAQVTTSEMGGDGELAGQIIVVSTALSIIAIFGWLSFMNFTNLL